MSEDSPVTLHTSDDSEFLQASQQARETFKYFWNQVSLDFNRIIPGLTVACVKAPFSDDFSDPDSPVEQMWVNEITFDGIDISGVLVNAPNWLKSLGQNDEVKFPLTRLSDWLCVLVMDGKVYGAHTVQLIRKRMDKTERKEYDQAWGFDFPSPDQVLIPERNPEFEAVIANLIVEGLEENPDLVSSTFSQGCTLLHLEALYGRVPSVQVLLDHGASTQIKCDRGWTALDYAQSLGWTEVISVITDQ